MSELYDTIGRGYERLRLPDARIEAQLLGALADCTSVVNVGAGAGSYEPRARSNVAVVAVEPSRTMIGNRPADAAPVARASAIQLPFRDDTFSASLAILTVHHWPDRARGLREMRRVARDRTVILTWDPAAPGFWLTDYFPEILAIDRKIFPSLAELREALGDITVDTVPIPADCTDGFLGAYWNRPEAYLRSEVRAAISTFAKLTDVETGLNKLRGDLQSGEWQRRYAEQLTGSALDLGYRLVTQNH